MNGRGERVQKTNGGLVHTKLAQPSPMQLSFWQAIFTFWSRWSRTNTLCQPRKLWPWSFIWFVTRCACEHTFSTASLDLKQLSMGREMIKDLQTLPANLPVPVDDGACDHLLGSTLPSVSLTSSGKAVDLSSYAGTLVIYFGYLHSEVGWRRFRSPICMKMKTRPRLDSASYPQLSWNYNWLENWARCANSCLGFK